MRHVYCGNAMNPDLQAQSDMLVQAIANAAHTAHQDMALGFGSIATLLIALIIIVAFKKR